MSDYIVLTKQQIAKLRKASAKAEKATDALIATIGGIFGEIEPAPVRAKPGRKPGRKPGQPAKAAPAVPASDLTA